MKHFLIIGLSCTALASTIACWFLLDAAQSAPRGRATELGKVSSAMEMAFLVKDPSTADSSGTAKTPAAFFDPLEITPGNLVPVLEQDVSSQVDGVFDEILVDVGRQIHKGDLLGRLDDRQLRAQVQLLTIRASSDASERIAKAQFDEADAKLTYANKANAGGPGVVSELEIKTYLYQRERCDFEMKRAREERETAQKELEKAMVVLQQHEIRAALSGEIVKVYKRNGETVKQADPVFRIANCNCLRVEGLCKIQQASLIRIGMRALVEPEVRGEQMTQLIGHTGAITALSISADGRLVASASADRSVLLWNWPEGTRREELLHPAEVTAVVFLGNSSDGCSVLTGSGNGHVWMWSVPAAGKPTSLKMMQQHEGAVRAIAFNADKSRYATGGDDKRIGIWETATGKHLYWLFAADSLSAHQGAVTHLRFCPDGLLVSAGRDHTVKVWKLSNEAGSLVRVHAGRTCEVSQLGVSPDGRSILLDLGEELRILDRDEGNCLGSLHSRRQGRFQTLAELAPSGRLMLTASSNLRLQLWSVPTSAAQTQFLRQGYTKGFHRSSLLSFTDPLGSATLAITSYQEKAPLLWNVSGSEIRHFVIPGASVVHTGVFSPDESVFFTGGSDKIVRVWPVPTTSQWQIPYEARITYVGNQIERGTDMVRIRAEFENPAEWGRRLRAGMFATLRIFPETAGLK